MTKDGNLSRLKERAREYLNSSEGIKHRKKRSIESEAVFGHTKENKQYNRFRHFMQDKVMMDFAVFAVALNIIKLHRTAKNMFRYVRKMRISVPLSVFAAFILHFYLTAIPIVDRKYGHHVGAA